MHIKRSTEELFVSADNHLHKLFVFKEKNVCCSSNQGVQVSLTDLEVNVKTVKNIQRNIRQEIVCHLDVGISFELVISCVLTYLDSCTVEWGVLILI